MSKFYWNKEINVATYDGISTKTYAAFGVYVFNVFVGVMKWGKDLK